MNQVLIGLESVRVEVQNRILIDNLSWKIRKGSHWAVMGASGAGKSVLMRTVLGRIPYRKGIIKYPLLPSKFDYQLKNQLIQGISFFDLSSKYLTKRDHYYQQRYHAYDNEGHKTVIDYLGKPPNSPEIRHLYQRIGIHELLDREIIKLSSGQGRRMMIAKILLDAPKVLWLDNPYVGLDHSGRSELNLILDEIINYQDTTLILSGNLPELPEGITDYLYLDAGRQINQNHFLVNYQSKFDFQVAQGVVDYFKETSFEDIRDPILKLQDATIATKDGYILRDIKWCISQGEKWCVFGENGAGKSTLLSLIFADHPQAYSIPMTIFGQKRGSGLSIWDIKSKIGFSSSELHAYFRYDKTFKQLVLSQELRIPHALNDRIEMVLERLIQYFEISAFTDIPFRHLPSGLQRLAFLIKALIFNPPLLILDEPFQAMDLLLVQKSKNLLDKILGPAHSLIFITHFDHEIPSCINKQLTLTRPKQPLKM